MSTDSEFRGLGIIDDAMIAASPSSVADTTRSGLHQGVVIVADDPASVHVRLSGETSGPSVTVPCSVLETASGRLALDAGDVVLVWMAEETAGVIIGRISAGRQTQAADQNEEALPETLVVEATEQIVLRVGDGSITIRADGKILIKGTDLVSHATRMNRIKGGAVAIN